MPKCPVIFLAFANEKESEARYLRGLAKEQDALRKALEPAVVAGLCELVVESNARVETILDTFQKARYKDRIAIFHYGGHADGYQLLLESLNESNVIAYGSGLVSFFSRQKGLQLIFLNGCSTQQQALDLTEAGVPAVIGTSQSIADEAAVSLAARFYHSLGQGNTVERAWEEAVDEFRIRSGDVHNRDIVLKFGASDQILRHFPWSIHYRKGADLVKEWNLPRASRNPLFGLQLPERYYQNLPETPFVGLNYFTENDAALFFGRGSQIRELYGHITGSTPIILLYGKSGVGKSSLLDAGLVPRLENDFEVVYIRRNQEDGLSSSLEKGLHTLLESSPKPEAGDDPQQKREAVRKLLEEAAEQSADQQLQLEIERLIAHLEHSGPGVLADSPDLLKKWQALEIRTGRPLVVIVDQVEECYTRPAPRQDNAKDELLDFLKSIQPLFTGEEGVQGKLIMSYRKEYHPEIRDTFRMLALPYAELFIKRLDREGIVEAVAGLNQHPDTKRKYKLHIEESGSSNLSRIIADDLLEDSQSPIAPVLQIILSKLWVAGNEEDAETVHFSITDYQLLKKQGVTMGEFFQQQMEKLQEKLPTVVHSGLALDLLRAHTTNLGTAGSCTKQDLLQYYDLEPLRISELLEALQQLSLLSRIDAETTILAHDTLAPVVMREYNLSDTPGQRAARIMKNRISDVGFTLNPAYLARLMDVGVPGVDDTELRKEHLGLDKYMTILKETLGHEGVQRDQETLLNHTIFNFQPGKKTITLSEADLSVVEEGAGLKKGLPGMRRLTRVEKELIYLSRAQHAQRQRQRRQLIATGIVALGLILASSIFAWFKMHDATMKTLDAEALAITAIARSLPREEIITSLQLMKVAYSKSPLPQVSQTLAAKFYDQLKIERENLPGCLIYNTVFKHKGEILSVAFSPDGQSILTSSSDSTARVWNVQGSLQTKIVNSASALINAIFSPDGQLVLTNSADGVTQLWSLNGESLISLRDVNIEVDTIFPPTSFESEWISTSIFSPDGQSILKTSRDSTVKLYDLKGQLQSKLVGHRGLITSAIFSPSGDSILTTSRDGTIKLWNLRGKMLNQFKTWANMAIFSPNGRSILTSQGGSVELWNIQGEEMATFSDIKKGDIVLADFWLTSAQFSPDGKRILAVTGHGFLKLWNLQGEELAQLGSARYAGSSEPWMFSPDGQSILTADNGVVKIWNLEGEELSVLKGHTHFISSAMFSPDGQSVLTASRDSTVKLWNINREELPILERSAKEIHSISWNPGSVIFSPDGQSILSTFKDSIAILWNLQGEELATLKNIHPDKGLVFSSDGSNILGITDNGSAKIWNSKGKELALFKNVHPDKGLVFSPDGSSVLGITDNGLVKLWNLQGDVLYLFTEGEEIANYTAFSPDGQKILIALRNEIIKLWDIKGELLSEFKITDRATRAKFSPDNRFILTTSEDASVKLWDLKGKLHFEVQPPEVPEEMFGGVSFDFSPDGNFIVIGYSMMFGLADDITKFLSLDGERLMEFQSQFSNPNPSSAIFSSDGKMILTGYSDFGNGSNTQLLMLWDLKGKALNGFKSERMSPSSDLIFSPDNQLILTEVNSSMSSSNADNPLRSDFEPIMAKLWSLNGETIAELVGNGLHPNNWRFSPDGRRVICSVGDGKIMIWPTPAHIYEYLIKKSPIPDIMDSQLEKYGIK